jgi:hypothetical protein
MDIKKEKQKIEKALRVIELIETCNKEIKHHNHYMVEYRTLKFYYEKRITIMQGVKARLENYYKNLIK